MKTIEKPDLITHPDKVMYPAAGFTKRDVADYYIGISKLLLPHLHGHPITLKRYPNGVNGPFFYERHCPTHRPDFVDTATVNSTTYAEGVCQCVINDLNSLLWVVNLGSLELHTLLSTQENIAQPSQLIFDLDPGPPAGIPDCVRVALALRVRPIQSSSAGQLGLALSGPRAHNRPLSVCANRVAWRSHGA